MSDSASTSGDTVYATRTIDSVGWFQPTADTSLRLVTAYGQPSSSVIDVGQERPRSGRAPEPRRDGCDSA